MRAYVYQAALLCEDCGFIAATKCVESDIESIKSEDSDTYPQGPYSDGGGESDSPQHCDYCGVFLQNPLTSDGLDYVKNAIAEHFARVNNKPFPLQDNNASSHAEEWARFYYLPFESTEEVV